MSRRTQRFDGETVERARARRAFIQAMWRERRDVLLELRELGNRSVRTWAEDHHIAEAWLIEWAIFAASIYECASRPPRRRPRGKMDYDWWDHQWAYERATDPERFLDLVRAETLVRDFKSLELVRAAGDFDDELDELWYFGHEDNRREAPGLRLNIRGPRKPYETKTAYVADVALQARRAAEEHWDSSSGPKTIPAKPKLNLQATWTVRRYVCNESFRKIAGRPDAVPAVRLGVYRMSRILPLPPLPEGRPSQAS
jgi:hypothetical protein